ncbi:MAG: hypothetical protein ACOC1G_03840 [Phycisphaeraceae bacterium]
MLAVIAGLLAIPFVVAGWYALAFPETLYTLILHADPASEVAPDVDLTPMRRLAVMMIVAGGILALTSAATVVMLFRWKTPSHRTGPAEQEEIRQPRTEDRKTNKLAP